MATKSKLKIKVEYLNTNSMQGKIKSKDNMTFAHNTLYKMYYPYIPYDTGATADKVDINQARILHKAKHKSGYYTYYVWDNSRHVNFKKEKHQLATAHWEQAMYKAKGKIFDKAIEDYINKK